MNKIDLKDYLQNKQYLLLFDIIIKKNVPNKDIFLESIDISPSTYRRSKTIEQKKGKKIINTLCNYFEMKTVTNEEVMQAEIYLNKLYYDYYYKLTNNYTYIIGKLNDKISNNNVLYPIYMLFKLLFILESNNSIILYETRYLYEEVSQYKQFYNNQLIEILNYIELFYDNKLFDINSNNGLVYYANGLKHLHNQKYIESLYYITNAKQVFITEENYKRVMDCNKIILEDLCYLKNYNQYNELASNLFFSTKENDESYYIFSKHYAISLIALQQYKEIKYIYSNISNITTTEILCLLIAKKNIDNNEYNKYYSDVLNLLEGNSKVEVIETINEYLKTNNNKLLQKIPHKICDELIYVLTNKN